MGDRTVHGMVSWKSLGRAAVRNPLGKTVADFLDDKPLILANSTSLFDTTADMIKREARPPRSASTRPGTPTPLSGSNPLGLGPRETPMRTASWSRYHCRRVFVHRDVPRPVRAQHQKRVIHRLDVPGWQAVGETHYRAARRTRAI